MSNKVEVSEFQAVVAEMPGSAAGAQDESAPDAKVRSMPLGHVIVQDHALRDPTANAWANLLAVVCLYQDRYRCCWAASPEAWSE